jgi:gliding motility-associated-like protein
VTATITGANFTTLILTADLVITEATVSGITFEDDSFVFDGTAKALAIGGTLPTGTSVVYTDNGRTNVGTQEVTATITGANFTTLILTADLVITEAAVSGITFEDDSFVFDGTAKALAIGGTLPTGTSVGYTNNSRTNIGTQEVTATITGANFTTLILTADLVITEAAVSGITFEDDSFVFDGTAKALAIGGTLPTGTSVVYTDNGRTNVGTQEVTATITGANFTTLILTADLVITEATVSGITFEDDSFVFDGTAKALAIGGTLPTGTSVGYTNNSRTNIGTQEVTATITGANFTTLILTADLVITEATVSGITFEDDSFVFDGTAKSLSIGGTLPTGTSVVYTNNSRTNVGTQEVTATITGSNYATQVLKAGLTITPATLQVIVDAGQTKVYGENDPTFTYTSSGLQVADVLTGTLIRIAGDHVGRYAINLGTLSAGSNYTIDFTPADFEITKATLSFISNQNQSKVFGDTDPVFTYVASGYKNGESATILSGALARASGEDVGMYAMNIGTLNPGSNYTIEFTSADFEITKRTLSIVANPNQAKVYGEADPVFAYTANNFGNGDIQALLTGALGREIGEDIGVYAILIGTLDAGSNYTVNFTSASFTIAAKVLNVTANVGQSKVFGTTDPLLAYTATGFENGDTDVILNGQLSRAAGENVGNYSINLGSLKASENYAINFTGASFAITKAMITGITFEDSNFVFDGTAKSLAVTGALPAGTSVEYTNNSRTNVGIQEVTATITGSNYTTMVLTAELTITKAMITGITFEDSNFVFDRTAKSLAVTGTLPAGTSVEYTNNSRTEVGIQEVTATIIGSNYTKMVLTAELEISPAELTITADAGQNKLYGEADPILRYSTSGFIAEDDETMLTGNLIRAEGEGVGIYAITLGTLDAGASYTIGYTGADFEIITTDTDKDGVADDVEIAQGTDPKDPTDYKDSDGDQVPDYIEELDGTSPTDPGDYLDSDGDKVPNYVEEQQGTDPKDKTDFPDQDNDGVPTYVEAQDGTDPTDPTDYKDSDGDQVPNYIEELDGTSPTDPGDYVDSDGDKVPDYVEEQQGTDANNSEDFLDTDGDGIPDFVQARAVSEFVKQSIEAIWGIKVEELKVPTEVVAITALGEFVNIEVTWDLTDYEPMMSGMKLYMGKVSLPAGLFNPNELNPMLGITVLAKPAPQDITLSANSFVPVPDKYFQDIGAFKVIDPADNVHIFSLPKGEVDNEYFEVLDGVLFWSSAAQAGGRTKFTILLQVTDRAGNVLDKSFQITRERTPLDQLDVPNSFTPNADGINETWGVPALRYYTGPRIQVFDNGGRRLFYTENPDTKWDGTYEGKTMPVGSYVYVIKVAETGETRRGILNLLKQ